MTRLPAPIGTTVAAVIVLAVTGCGGGASAPEVAFPTPSPRGALPAVTVECEGGVAGVQERVDVRPDGTATGTQSRATGTTSTRLSPDERGRLADAVRRAVAQTYRATYETDEHVGDLFRYRIEIGPVAVSADQLTIPQPLDDIVRVLAPARTRLDLTC